MRRPPWPLVAAVVGSALFVASVTTGTYHPSGDSTADAIVFLTTAPAVAVVSVFLGLLPRRTESLLGLMVLTVGIEVGNVNPFPAMITVGFWLVGAAARSHGQLAAALQGRAFELESSREAFTVEAMRYERARIARELHDIVAHSLSVIVIQASAGQRLPASTAGGPEMRADIVSLTREVRRDLAGLSRLLDADPAGTPLLTRQSLDDLLGRTAAAGSTPICEVAEGLDQLPPRTSEIAYRALQEGLTNAIKHAPGAPIYVRIRLTDSVSVMVTNGVSPSGAAGPAAPGSGRGLAGLTERVSSAGGRFTVGPTDQDGWRLCVELPLPQPAPLASVSSVVTGTS